MSTDDGWDIRSRLQGVKWKDVYDYTGYRPGYFSCPGYFSFLFTGKHLGMPTLALVCEREFIALKRCTPTKLHENSAVWTRPLHTAFTLSPRIDISLRLVLDRCEANTFDLESLILPEPEHEETPDA